MTTMAMTNTKHPNEVSSNLKPKGGFAEVSGMEVKDHLRQVERVKKKKAFGSQMG